MIFRFTTAPAMAGTNGQQLRLDVTCSYAPALAEVKVIGFNQRNPRERVTWYAQPNAKGVVTYHWWWVGAVNVEYRYVGLNQWYGLTVNVPKVFNRDIYPVAIDQDLACEPAYQVP
jgi:hypothetical protein